MADLQQKNKLGFIMFLTESEIKTPVHKDDSGSDALS